MASSRTMKMFSALGIRFEKDDSKSQLKVVTETDHDGIMGEKMGDVTVDNTASEFTSEICSYPDIADKENLPPVSNADHQNCLKMCESSLEHVDKEHIDDLRELDSTNETEKEPAIACLKMSYSSRGHVDKEHHDDMEIPGVSTKVGEDPVIGAQNSPSSSCDSTSTDSYSDFSSDDSVKDPNYFKEGSSSSSTSEDEILKNSGAEENRVEIVETVEGGTKKKTRKKKSQPSTWDKNRTKRLRNSGKSYKTYHKKVEVAARTIKPPCDSEKCKQKCTTKFIEEERLTLFEKYWAMADIIKQRTYLVTLMETVNTAKEKRRNNNHAFYFLKEGKKIRVCKVFFISTLGITSRCIRTTISKIQDGSLGDDLRGKHDKHRQVSQDIKDGVRKHISSIPTIESHYTRKHSEKNYIEGGKTIAQLYRDYQDDSEKDNKPYAKFSMYRDIFNHEFNIAFFVPKKDQCQTCVTFQNSSEEEKRNMKEQYEKHQEEKTLSRDEKLKDKTLVAPNYHACFDLQAALSTPNGQVSSFYYRSKLATYNFTVCHLDKKGQGNVYSFMWHEGEGKRGAIEIGTCLLKFLEMTAGKANSEDLQIVFYSDNCAGQQKNKFVLGAFLYAVANYKIKSITHKYLITGHTQNEGDNVHSLIEKNIKRALKSGTIYTPAQYVTLVQTAKKSGPPFKVIELTHDDFLDLKNLTERTISNNLRTNSEGQVLKFSDVSILKVEKENLSHFLYKTSYKDVDFKSVNLVAERRTRNPINLPSLKGFKIEKAYQEKLPISKKKYDDLMFLVKSNAITKSHSDFYTNLKCDEN